LTQNGRHCTCNFYGQPGLRGAGTRAGKNTS
jgi:hypothetical protein